jgi:signal transduction histidine kinase
MEQLEQANRELEAFSYTTSHDLKTPLNAIRGFSELLLDRSAELDPVSRRQLSRILGASEHMRRTIDGLLSLARAGQAAVVREEVDLSALAAGVTERLAAAHEGRAVTVEIQPRMVVQADPPLLEVVLANLLGNAWKFTRSSPDARISVTAAFDSNPTVFCVSDNGVGFDPAMVHHLFRAFQRLHSAAEFEGSGIGLATVQRIVTRHGGSIRAESSVGGGARFYFTLAPAEAPQDSGEGRGQRGALGTDALMKH